MAYSVSEPSNKHFPLRNTVLWQIIIDEFSIFLRSFHWGALLGPRVGEDPPEFLVLKIGESKVFQVLKLKCE